MRLPLDQGAGSAAATRPLRTLIVDTRTRACSRRLAAADVREVLRG